MNSNKQVKAIVGHTDAISSLMLFNNKSNNNNNNTIISGGHDGAVRAWDLRTF